MELKDYRLLKSESSLVVGGKEGIEEEISFHFPWVGFHFAPRWRKRR